MGKENLYQKSIELINDFFLIQPLQNDFEKKVFETLKKIINFDSGYIFYINPDNLRLEYSYNAKSEIKQKNEMKISKKLHDEIYKNIPCREIGELLDIQEPFLIEKLAIQNTIFGLIVITGGNECDEDSKTIFRTCATIISNLTKDVEISKILNMQVQALQEGILDVQHENKKILASEKIKNNFLSNISHELRTPLNSIIGFSELLSKEFVGTLNNKQKDYLKDIHVSGLHLLGMINEVLDISKLESNAINMNCKHFNIDQAITEVCNILLPIAQKKNIIFIKDIEDIEIHADSQKITQILFNLINNALKFTNELGKVEIKTRYDENNLTIDIIDNGIGIDKKFHKKIFKKFEQIKNSEDNNFNSTGLGLTITKELVRLHNGTIKVESELNKGSKFTVILPLG